MDIPTFRRAHAEMVRRMPASVNEALAPLHRATRGPLDLVEEAGRLREQTVATGKYSKDGINDIVKRHLAGEPARILAEHARNIENAKASLAERRANLGKPKIDRTDVFAELQRQELRAALRGMPAADRTRLALGGDPAVIEAVLSAAPALSGLNPNEIAMVQKIAVETHHAKESTDLDEMNDAIAVAEAVVTMARTTIGALVPGDPNPFEIAA